MPLPTPSKAPSSPKKFDIRDHIDKLEPSAKDKFYCPVCGKNDLSINKETGAYSCFSGECAPEEIREAISPWADKQGENRDRFKRIIPQAKRKPTPQPVPENLALLRLPAPATDRPQRTPGFDSKRGDVNEIIYSYSETQWVQRIEWKDLSYPKGRDKTFRQWHRDEGGKAICKKGDRPWKPYRIDEALSAAAAADPALALALTLVEGEECVEALRSIGLASITLQGSNWSKEELERMVEAIKASPVRCLIYIKDNDEAGNIKAKKISDACTKGALAYMVIDPVVFNPDLPEKGDAADVLATMNREEFIERLEADIHRGVAARSLELEAETIGESPQEKEKKTRKIPPPDQVAEKIAEDYRDKLAFNNVTGCWMRYEPEQPGVWSVETDEFIESIVSGILKTIPISGYGSHSYITNIVKKLRCELMQWKWVEPPANELLPFHDGVLELATGKLLPHSPGYKFTWALERSHDSNATDWSLIDQFLTHATGGNDRLKEILICYCNAVLMGRADLQKFLHLTGPGGTGKGTYTRLIVDLIGQTNVHSSTLDDWCGNRFEAANAFGKRLVVFWDEDKALKQLGRFKSLIGQDLLRGEEKGKKAFQFRFDGMVAVSSNFPIFAGDNSSGMSRRVIGIPFNATIAASKRRDLSKDFQPQLAAFTNYLLTIPSQHVTDVLLGLEAAPELNQQFWESRIRTDSVAAWLNDRVIRDPLATTPVGNDAEDERMLYGSYVQHCRKSGTPARGNKNFSPDLLELCRTILGWTEIEKVHTKTGKLIKGLRLRDDSRDGNIPTYDYELLQEVKGQVKGSEGYGDGSEPLPSQAVTDSDGLNKISKSGLKEDEIQSTVNVQRATENTDESTSIKDVEPDPSLSVTPLPSKAPDPSLDPSPDPSLAMGEEEIGHDCSPEEIANIAQMILEATDGISLMQVMSLFVNSSEKAKKEVWKRLTPEERERIETLKAQAQRDAQPGVKCWVKCPEDYVWRKATLISVPKFPGITYWRFELEDELEEVKKDQLIHTRRDSVGSSWWLIA